MLTLAHAMAITLDTSHCCLAADLDAHLQEARRAVAGLETNGTGVVKLNRRVFAGYLEPDHGRIGLS